MKVEKEPGRHGGFNIYVIIGRKENKSYFSAPSENIDHAGLEYISDRFPIINTKKKTDDFKRLYKNLWIEITDYQRELMEHCIGLNYKKKPYRNYFFTKETDKDWNELVQKGLAIKSLNRPIEDGYMYFWLTRQGIEFILRKSVSENFYKEL